MQEINDGMGNPGFGHSSLVVRLLDTPEVQRTGHIIQNGLCELAFPGIAYKRKAHLIGVARVGALTYNSIESKGFRMDDEEKSAIEALAITHDTGHSPFSHSISHIMERVSGMSHEDFSARIVRGDVSFYDYFMEKPHLLGEPSFVREMLSKYKSAESIPEILRSEGVDPAFVSSCLDDGGEGISIPSDKMFIKNLIDGKIIDIDKMDYLPRDSRAANVPEGYVDPGRMISSMNVVDFGGQKRLALSDDSLDMLGFWVKARKYMRQNVYTHKTVLKGETMLAEAVKRSMPYFRENDIEVHWLTDGKLMGLLTEYDSISCSLVSDLMYGRPFKYSEAFSIKSRAVPAAGDDPNMEKLLAIEAFEDDSGYFFPEDSVRRGILDVANRSGRRMDEHEILIYQNRVPAGDALSGKMDLMIYRNNNPSEAVPLSSLMENGSYDGHAEELVSQMKKPDFSTYFAVYCPKEHAERVRKATENFIQDIMADGCK
ncbi:MAG: HD domain-containing protein [Candidatus Woesearchaeota archaeon]